jgi:cation diffusion facilitator family transporter
LLKNREVCQKQEHPNYWQDPLQKRVHPINRQNEACFPNKPRLRPDVQGYYQSNQTLIKMKEKIAIISILANVFLAGGKILIGSLSHSTAVLAEGLHSLTDIFSSIIGYFGIKFSQKPIDQKHPYGHYKVEVVSGLIITLILLATGVGIIYEAAKNISQPQVTQIDYLVFSIMIASVVINFVTSKIKIYYGKKENSLTLLSDGTHDKADVAVSVAVLIGLFLNRYWIYTDSVLAILIGLYIIKESFPLGKEAIDSLLDVSAGEEIENKIKAILEEEKVDLASLRTQKKGSTLTANLEIKLPKDLKVEEATKMSEHLRKKLMQNVPNLQYVAIQIASHEIETSFYQPKFGRGFSWKRRGKFKDQYEQATGKGPDGYCFCPKCGYKVVHQRGIPCSSLKCPHCHINLERK